MQERTEASLTMLCGDRTSVVISCMPVVSTRLPVAPVKIGTADALGAGAEPRHICVAATVAIQRYKSPAGAGPPDRLSSG